MQGVITHNNSRLLDDLVIIDPLWLLRTVTSVIRRLDLHPLPINVILPKVPFELLYKKGISSSATIMSFRVGILELQLIPRLWEGLNEKLRRQLLGLMVQVGTKLRFVALTIWVLDRTRCSY